MPRNEEKRRDRRWLVAVLLPVSLLLVLAASGAFARSSGIATAARQEGPYAFTPGALGRLEAAFDSYEKIRSGLSSDSVTGLAGEAAAVATRLEEAVREVPASAPRMRSLLTAATAAARTLGTREEIEAARHDFGELSRLLIALAQADARLTRGRWVFYCPMTPTYPKWFQKVETLANPYYGSKMLTCGSASTWEAEIPPGLLSTGEAPVPADPDTIAYYTCPMHPSIHASQPGACPICGMDLVPVRQQELESGVVLVDPVRQQKIGVRIEPAQHEPMILQVRAVGRLTWDDGRLTDVSLKVGGWIEDLFVSDLSHRVEEGEPLFTLYSPELYAAQRDYLQLVRDGGASGPLVETARERLLLADMTAGQIETITRTGQPMLHVPVLSPAGGFVVAREVVRGASVRPGERLYRIADLGRIWVEAEVYESDLALLRTGQQARVRLSYLPDRSFSAEITRIYPYLEGATRTGRVRLELDNPALELKPDMYADVDLEVDLGRPLQVPASAVIYTGPRRIVMVEVGEGRFQPREIQTGRRTEERIEVLSGLQAGERVVSSGTFLIAAESRLRSAAGYWEGGHAGH